MVISTPRGIDIEITSKCNARCLYCYYFNNPAIDEYRDLPTEEWLTFFDELGRLGVMELTLAGGEAFVRPDLKELINGITRNHMRFSILSNAKLITDDMAKFLANTHRCNHVQISIDGASAEIHDIARGKGSFEGAINGMRILQRNGVPIAVRVTIHHYNVRHLEDIAVFLLEQIGLPSFSTNSAGYLGSCQRNAQKLLLSTEERQYAMETLLKLEKRYKGRISADAGPLAEGRWWGRMETARLSGEEPFPNGGRLTSCGCSFSKLAVRSDGVIVPCNLLAHMELGHINRDSLQDIWINNEILNQHRHRSRISLENFEECADCGYRPYCTGNCPALAYTISGQVDVPSPDACLRRYLEQGGKLPAREDISF